jgi:hypothetical protein
MSKKGDDSSNKLAIVSHILGIITFFLGPLIISLTTKNIKTKNNALIALNWQINVIIYVLVSLILMVVLVGHILLPAVLIANIAFSIIGAIKASKNQPWTYPLSFQFLRTEN